MHLCVTGTVKQKGESPSHGSTVSYTTASALVLLNTTHHLCQPKAAKPSSFAAVSPARTSTVTKSVPWLHFGHKAALGGCSLATTKMHQTRCDSPDKMWLRKQLHRRASTAQLPDACARMVRETGPMDSPAVIRQKQALCQPRSSWDWKQNNGNTAPTGTDGPRLGWNRLLGPQAGGWARARGGRGPLVPRGPWWWVPN